MRSKCGGGFALLIAVLAMGAVGSATASAALPEIVNKSGGELVKKKFTITTVGTGHLTHIGSDIDTFCLNGTGTGEIQGLQGGQTTLNLKGCEIGGKTCKTEGKPELIVPLSVTLVYLNKAKHSMALLYSTGSGAPFICNEQKKKLIGSFLTRLPEVASNKLLTKVELSAEGSAGAQSPAEYENEKGEKIHSGLELEYLKEKFEAVGWSFTESLKFEEEVEFKG
jgi:hypothetical protein